MIMDRILILQINLHKSWKAQANFMVELNSIKSKHFICLIQEPHFSGKFGLIPTYINRKHMQVMHGKGTTTQWPRAMIVASKGINMSMVESLSSRDTTCVKLHALKEEILMCSSYQDQTVEDNVIYNIDKCVEKAKTNNEQIIIGTDSNAHSQLWMSEKSNSRGEIFEDLIASNNLSVCNIGSKFTYECATGKSIIDVTLASNNLTDRITEWKVHDEDYFSDHKLISFKFDLNIATTAKFRNFKKANWPYFTSLLAATKWVDPPKIWSHEIIETEVDKLSKDIIKALDKVCPEKEHKIKRQQPIWWSAELHNLRKKVRALYKHWKKASPNTGVQADRYNTYKSVNKEYFKSIDKAKKASWRKFTSECEDIYLLNKIIHKKQQSSISMMEGCNTGLETNNLLMDSHFPGSTSMGDNLHSTSSQVKLVDANPETDNDALQAPCPEQEAEGDPSRYQQKFVLDKHLIGMEFLDPHNVKEAFKNMKAFNSGGPSGMKAIVFQKLPYNFLVRISKIYKACMKLSYTPKPWCVANVIFLAKPGKDRYDTANSHRPISMFEVPLKGKEKLVKWDLERNSLSEKPLHKDQHAFRRHLGTDTALVRVVDIIEKGLLIRGQITFGFFIDIRGAFNNIKTDKALDAMRERGLPENLVSWYESFVTNRVAHSELLGSNLKRKLHLGTPQGGVISPLFWNIPFDELLELLNKIPGITAIGFADDLVILNTGIDELTLSNMMQRAINMTKNWLSKYGLSISPEKSAAVMFTLRKKVKEHQVKIDNVTIPFQKEVKYLGVILDSKLLWTSHVQHKLGKAKRHLMAFHNAITKKYGPNPILMKRAFTTIVLPAFTYACHVWGDKCQQVTIKGALNRLNRLACLLIANVAPSTPTKGLEVIYNILPIHILIEKIASETMARIQHQLRPSWSGIGTKRNGLIFRWKSARTGISNTFKTDRIPTKLVKERKFTIHTPDDGRTKLKEATGIISYTDGSVLDNKTGCGIHTTLGQRVIYNGNFYLGNNTTVFQAEVKALQKSADMLYNKGWTNQTITFFSDSQASLAALNKLTVNSDTVDKCINALNVLGTKNKVHLRWVKAHVGIPGNEVADFLAKRGTTLGEGPSNDMWPAVAKQKAEIKSYFHKKWTKAWNAYKEARQTKIWFPIPDIKKSVQLLNMKRCNLSRIVQFITGHNNLKRHRNIQNGVNDPESCRLCQEDEESSYHVIAECPAMQYFRGKIFQTPTLLPDPPVWTVMQIDRFLRESPIGDMLDSME